LNEVEFPRRRRGVYVIPTSLTVLNVFFGFLAILLSLRASQQMALGGIVEAGRLFQLACWSIGVAAIFDTFDGLVARLMNATSEFGKEYDSLADVVTFGAAPAVLVYSWGLHTWGRLGAGIAFLFLVAGSLRLARFNTLAAKTDHRFFAGLPIPAGALTLAAIINYAPHPVTDRNFGLVMMLVTVGLAFAMVSTLRYRSQKYASLQKERSFTYILVLAVFLVVLYRWTAEVFFLAAITYVVSGPLLRLWTIAFPSRPVTGISESEAS
jgi:CDP-diacylglycerol---serine O-phosphatidyltransferase